MWRDRRVSYPLRHHSTPCCFSIRFSNRGVGAPRGARFVGLIWRGARLVGQGRACAAARVLLALSARAAFVSKVIRLPRGSPRRASPSRPSAERPDYAEADETPQHSRSPFIPHMLCLSLSLWKPENSQWQ